MEDIRERLASIMKEISDFEYSVPSETTKNKGVTGDGRSIIVFVLPLLVVLVFVVPDLAISLSASIFSSFLFSKIYDRYFKKDFFSKIASRTIQRYRFFYERRIFEEFASDLELSEYGRDRGYLIDKKPDKGTAADKILEQQAVANLLYQEKEKERSSLAFPTAFAMATLTLLSVIYDVAFNIFLVNFLALLPFTILSVRNYCIRYRILRGYYGDNVSEARELISFIESISDDITPPPDDEDSMKAFPSGVLGDEASSSGEMLGEGAS